MNTDFPHLERTDLDDVEALAELFTLLANENRLRILHAIHRAGEAGPTDISEHVDLSLQVVSNQLRRLSDQRVVHSRRDGRNVLYRIIDPCVPGLLDLAVCLVAERDG